MRSLAGRVVDGAHGDTLGRVPVRRVEGQRQRVGVGGADADAALRIRLEVYPDRPCGRLGENDGIAVGLQPGRCGRVGTGHARLLDRAAFGDHRAQAVRYAVVRRRIVVVRRDIDRCGIVVDHGGDHAQDRQAVVGAAVLGALALLRPVHDGVAVVAFGQFVVRRIDVYGLRNEPIVAREDQRQAILARLAIDHILRGQRTGAERDAAAAGTARALRQRHRHRRDDDLFLGGAREHDLVGVDNQIVGAVGHWLALEDADRAIDLLHHHGGGVVVGHMCGNVLREDALIGRIRAVDRCDHEAAVPLQVVADHGDRVATAAADVEGVAAAAADDFQRRAGAGALDEEAVVALERVDDNLLQPGEGDVEAGAVDAAVGDDEIVAEFGADHGQGVEAVTAVDAHRRVDGVGHEVGALPAVDVGVGRFGVVRIDLDESAHGEGVVVFVAKQEQLGLVAVDGEIVVADAAEQGGALRHAVGKEAARDLGGLEVVFLGQPVGGIAAIAERLVDLAHLEGVGPGVAEDGGRREVVVEHEGVVAGAAVNLDRTADVGVVIDALDHAACHRQPVGIDLDGGDHADADVVVGAQEEEVGQIGAVDAQAVDAGVAARLVEHVDARRDLSGKPNLVEVAALLAMQGQNSIDAAGQGLLAVLIVIDANHVVAGAGIDGGRAGNAVDVDDVVGAVDDRRLVTGDQQRRTGVGGIDVDLVVVVREPNRQQVKTGIADAKRHAHAGERVAGELRTFALGVAGIVNLEHIGIAGAGDKVEPRGDAVDVGLEGIESAIDHADAAGHAADPHGVVAGARVDPGRPGGGLDVEDVGAGTARQEGLRTIAVGAPDGEHIATDGGAAERDAQRLQRAVGDAAGGAHQQDIVRIARDRRAGDPVGHAGGRQRAVVDEGIGGVVEPQQVGAATVLAIDRECGLDLVQGAAAVAIGQPEVAEGRVAADVDRVAAAAGIECGAGMDGLDHHPVVAAAGIDLDVLDPLVGDAHPRRERALAITEVLRDDVAGVGRVSVRQAVGDQAHRVAEVRRDRRRKAGRRTADTGTVDRARTGTVDGKQEAVGVGAARDHQAVARIARGRADFDHCAARGRHRHKVMFGELGVVGRVVENCQAIPVEHAQAVGADADAVVEIIDHHGVVAAPADQHRYLENVLEILDGGIGGEAIAGIDEFGIDVLVVLEGGTPRGVLQVADHQAVVVEADVGAGGLVAQAEVDDQGVDFAGA